MRLRGWPAKRLLKPSVQPIEKPQLAGRRGAISRPSRPRISAQLPSEPRRGQLAPPSARMVVSGSAARLVAVGLWKTRRPAVSQPRQKCLVWMVTPCRSSRRSQPAPAGQRRWSRLLSGSLSRVLLSPHPAALRRGWPSRSPAPLRQREAGPCVRWSRGVCPPACRCPDLPGITRETAAA